MVLPNFIGIGAPKAGTTWLSTCLAEHPDCFMARVKETEFWKLHDAENRLAEYGAHFRGAERRRAIGEFSVRYLSLPGVPERIKRVLPKAKLIVCLRSPVDQVCSNYWHLQRQNFNLSDASKAPRSIEDAIETQSDFLLGPARYATHLQRWLDLFPREQLLVILYDDICHCPAGVLKVAFSFLDISPSFRPGSTLERGSAVRKGTSPRSETAARWHSRFYGGLVKNIYAPLKRIAGTRNAALLKDVLRVRTLMEAVFMRQGYPAMRPQTRSRLVREFAPEIEQLERLTGLNLDRWKVADKSA